MRVCFLLKIRTFVNEVDKAFLHILIFPVKESQDDFSIRAVSISHNTC